MRDFVLLALAGLDEGIPVDCENRGSRIDSVDMLKFEYGSAGVDNSKWMVARSDDEYAVHGI
jgi:hypothetical protein